MHLVDRDVKYSKTNLLITQMIKQHRNDTPLELYHSEIHFLLPKSKTILDANKNLKQSLSCFISTKSRCLYYMQHLE